MIAIVKLKKTYSNFKREQTVTDEPLSTEIATFCLFFTQYIIQVEQGIINQVKKLGPKY